MTNRKFYKTTITVEVLSEEPLKEDMPLTDIAYEMIDGNCSGEVKFGTVEQLNGKEAAKALEMQGSDPEFFQIDAEGNDIE